MPRPETKIPLSALFFLVSGLVAILAVVTLLILPVVRENSGLGREIADHLAMIEEKRQLAPLQARMLALRENQRELALPPVPEPVPAAGDIKLIAAEIEELTRRAGMRLVKVAPSPASLQDDGHKLMITVVVEGEFIPFRELLLDLLATPYLYALPALQIREIAGGRQFELRMLVLLS